MKILKFILFGGLGKYYLTNQIAIDVNKRLRAMGLEMVYTLSVVMPLLLPAIIFSIVTDRTEVGQIYQNSLQPKDIFAMLLSSLFQQTKYYKQTFGLSSCR